MSNPIRVHNDRVLPAVRAATHFGIASAPTSVEADEVVDNPGLVVLGCGGASCEHEPIAIQVREYDLES